MGRASCRWLIVARIGIGGFITLLCSSAATAQAWWEAIEDSKPEIQRGFLPVPSIGTSLPHNGDPFGTRKWLGERGVIVGLEYTNDLLSNLRGGVRTGTIDQGKLQGIVTVDFAKLSGWHGLTMFANFFQIHNTGRIRRDYVGGINTIAAIEAVPATRLSEIWFEQKFADDKASIRVGQLAADAEFFYSELSTMFLQSDWPTIAALNLPSGGAAYPLSTPAVRLKINPYKDVSLLLAVFNGDPAGPGVEGEEQLRNRHGLNFRVNDPPFTIGEAQFQRNMAPQDTGLATTLKLGGWHHFGRFDNRRFLTDDVLIGTSFGPDAIHRGNFGVYAIIDQQLYRPPGGDSQSGISVFSRGSLSPSDRNLINSYIDGGIVFAGLIPSRPKDRFGAAVIHARFSNSVHSIDPETLAFTVPIRDHETNLELSYQAQIVPGWTVQPNLQFVWHPSGDPATRTATVAGVRSQWRY